MKTKKIIAALLAGVLAATTVVSASAVDVQLNDNTPEGTTKVYATIDGSTPGDVSYIITIPEEVSFGTLTQPESADEDSYKYCNFNVVATQIDIDAQQIVSVYLREGLENSSTFYLTQQGVENATTFTYDVYGSEVTDANIAESTPLNAKDPSEDGYFLVHFGYDAQGTAQPVTLVFNEKDLFGPTLDSIAGDYSGSLVFRSSLKEILG